MPMFIKLSLMSAVPVIISALLYLIDTKTGFNKLKYIHKQIIVGLIFGLIAICGTEFGVNVDGATINVRNAAPLCAGLIFGAPAGIISGVIGGTERFFAAFWGAGAYTQIACSITTVLAGVLAAVTRKFLFDNRRISWFYGLVIATLTEIFDMLMIFLTNSSDVHTAFTVVRKCTFLMVSFNALAVTLAILLVSFIGGDYKRRERCVKRRISRTFSRYLLLCVSVAFIITISFSMFLQSQLTKSDTLELLSLNIDDVKADISDASDENLLDLTKLIANEIGSQDDISEEYLIELEEKYDVAEINIIDESGIIILSTYDGFIDYDMNGGKQSKEFLVLLDGKTEEYVQKYGPTSSDSTILRKYAGVALESGFVQVAYDAERFQRDIDEQVIGSTRNRHVGENGSIIIVNEKGEIVSDRKDNEGENISITGMSADDSFLQENCFKAKVYGQQCYCMYDVSEGYYIIAAIPEVDVEFGADLSIYITAFMLFVVFSALFILVYLLIKKLIVSNIHKINRSLSEITGGNLDVVVDVRSNEEFSSLSDDINSTVVTLKGYIAEAEARIDKELEFARTIQHSALPGVFPPYPNRTEFDIYASMTTAKEVGGDFYDFYLLGENRLAFLIADVSGKGIPAAMFMMTSKTLIKSLAEAGNEISDVFTLANKKLCENNDAGMFITAWMGIIDLKTGKVEFANAGHNPPIIRHKDGSFEYLKCSAGFILAIMDGVEYHKSEIYLESGDEIFLYTDGVTEATDVNNNAYGADRLLRLLNENKCVDSKSLCELVKRDIDRFVGDAPQFDDITMLSLKYNNKMV